MANSTRFLQTAKNRIPFLKNVSTNVILLASLFIISIIIYYMLNKRSLENMDNENDNGDKLVEGGPSNRRPTAVEKAVDAANAIAGKWQRRY